MDSRLRGNDEERGMQMKTTFRSFFSHEVFLFLMSFPGPYWSPAFMEKQEVYSL